MPADVTIAGSRSFQVTDRPVRVVLSSSDISWRIPAMASATKNFHLPLPEALYNELRRAAREVDQPATRFAQELMRAGLDEWRRARRRQEIAAYARQVAGSSEDLDPELEHAGVQSLVKDR